METKTNAGLVAWARRMIGQPYWYGTYCNPCTASLYKAKAKQYPDHYGEGRTARYQDDIAKGKTCADCVGLIKGYYWEKDGRISYTSATDFGANGMERNAKVKGPIATLPEVPGLCVWKDGHIGIYEGGGYVIEAKGFAHGVVRSKLSDTKWEKWLECPVIENKEVANMKIPYVAKVQTKTGNGIGLWSDSAHTRKIMHIPDGALVEVRGEADDIGHRKCIYGEQVGVCDSQYLLPMKELESSPEPTPTSNYAVVISTYKGTPLSPAQAGNILDDFMAQGYGALLVAVEKEG